ncbi:MAG: hypothetical protein AB9842_05055 [Bacteroidales bacterium]
MKKLNSLLLVTIISAAFCLSGFSAMAFNVTFQVNMYGHNVPPEGVHIAGNWQGWDPGSTPMTLLSGTIYTYTVDLEPGQVYQYKFINGNAWGMDEYPPAECGMDNTVGGFNRYFTMPEQDIVLPLVCFGLCTDCPVISGRVTYDNNLNSPLVAAVHLINDAQQEVAVSYTDPDGNYGFMWPPDGTYTLMVTTNMPAKGINSADALKVMKHFVAMETLSGLPLLAAEANGDEAVNATDAELIVKKYTGFLPAFLQSAWIFETPQVTYVNGFHVEQNIKGICRGDVNKSYVPVP